MSAAPIDSLVHPSLDTQWWWDALARGELLVPACRACHTRFFPPQAFCPECGSHDVFGAATSGHGTVYSWVVIHRAFTPDLEAEVPYAVTAIDMEEGGRLIGRYHGDLNALRAGLPVKLRITQRSGTPILGFEPVA